jgi:leucyl/phenylalanyl-tRNA--protein transferase
MHEAYLALHRLGYAHSIEVWSGNMLVGGLYGVAIGQMFFAESMFSVVTGGSKAALAALGAILHEWKWPLFDAQVASAHLLRMGAIALPRTRFLHLVAEQVALSSRMGAWTQAIGERDMTWLLVAIV